MSVSGRRRAFLISWDYLPLRWGPGWRRQRRGQRVAEKWRLIGRQGYITEAGSEMGAAA